ncbi:hypothetical protein J5N97_022844 [Dioscorea zingiberensis]|uniref:Calcineurin-like phosphoesterase domain-containing protein n=1 Tax=Dioscorea zingiberensis TaxID=325984 RepID=A0A9D5CB82_9LILI|nr:hypothetical protein J5N97_022844 [Dioscorea zingiberensis]
MVVPPLVSSPSRLLSPFNCVIDACNRSSVAERRRRGMSLSCLSRQQDLPARCLYNCLTDSAGPRVFVVSDLHTDYSENMGWVRRLSHVLYKKDVLLVAGDVAETYKNFVNTMAELRDRFQVVFFVPGNHDLWCRREGENYLDSLEKLDALLDACSELGVSTIPRIVNGVGIIPLFSCFDKEKDVTGVRIPSIEMACKDFHACRWPGELSNKDASLSQYFDLLNIKNNDAIEQIREKSDQIITFSHFIPRQELCPEKRMLFYPNLPKIIGSDPLEVRIRSIHGQKGSMSACHVFGHTHFCWDAILDGIRLKDGTSYSLGIQVKQEFGRILVSQRKYAARSICILVSQTYGYTNGKLNATVTNPAFQSRGKLMFASN